MNFVIVFILLLLITSLYRSIKGIYVSEYINQTEALASQYNKRSEYYIDSYESIAKCIAENGMVRKAVCENINDYELNYVLTDMTKVYSDILGVSVYSEDYDFFSDRVIGSAPDLEFIKNKYIQNAEFKGDICWVIRTPDSYAGYYDRVSYSSCDQGLYTCIYKIRDDYGKIAGYLLLDTNISELFKIYRNENTFEQQMDIYLKKSDFVIGDKDNKNNNLEFVKEAEPKEEKSLIDDRIIYIFYPLPSSENQLVIGASIDKIYNMLYITVAMMILIGIIFYIGSIWVINRFIGGIIQSAGKLNDKIRNYNIDEK